MSGPGPGLGSGAVVAGRYRVHERLGAGGMGVVYRATDTHLKRQVALKRVHLRDVGGDEAADVRRRTLREAEIVARVHHPRIVSIFDVLDDPDGPFLVLEYLRSRDLSALLDDVGVLVPGAAARAGAQVAEALAAAHAAGIVHRDVKPGNVLVGEGDPLGPVKLTDFGISHLPGAHSLTSAGFGTPPYFAPEVALGRDPDPAADVYALGATLRVATEGAPPFGWVESNPLELIRRIGRDPVPEPAAGGPLGDLLSRMTAADPDDRPDAASAAEQLWELADRREPLHPVLRSDVPRARATAGGARDTNGPDSGDPTQRPRRRRAVPGGAAGVVAGVAVLAVLAAVLVAVVRSYGDGPTAPDGFPAAIGVRDVGDPRTADPCSLVDPAALAGFGDVAAEPDYGGFAICAVNVAQPGGETVEVTTELAPPSNGVPSGGTQRLGDATLVRRAPDGQRCERILQIADGTPITVAAAYHGNGRPTTDLCRAAETAAGSAATTLAESGVGRREPPAARLWSTDACTLLTGTDLAFPASDERGYRGFGGWSCEWDSGTAPVARVLLSFDRLTPPSMTGDPVPGTPAFVRTDTGDDDGCAVEIPDRTYRGVLAAALAEVVRVQVVGSGPRQALCARAVTLAVAAHSRLR